MLIPINFLLTLICLLLLLLQRRSSGRMFQILLFLCLTHSLISGLTLLAEGWWHWLQPVTAAALPLMCCLAIDETGGKPAVRIVCAVTLSLMIASVLLLPQMIDWLMAAIWLGCAAYILLSIRQKDDNALAHSGLTLRGWQWLALLLLAVAVLDGTLSVLIVFAGRAGVPALMLTGNLLTAAVMSMLLLSARAGPKPLSRAVRVASDDDQRVLACVEELMRAGLYREPALNLARLARKTGIPARQVSAAINALHQQSVSHYVNSWRVREAGQLLVESGASVISIMEQVGFQTKSNFNREFLRLTGKTPSQWRKDADKEAKVV